jgi:hypothetical protein
MIFAAHAHVHVQKKAFMALTKRLASGIELWNFFSNQSLLCLDISF